MDIRTVFQAQPFLGLLLMVILVYVWRTRKTYPGFGYAILQHIGITLGMQFVSLRGTIPLFVSALLGNGLFLAGMLLALQGIKTFLGRGRMHQGYWIAFVLLEIGVAWFLYVSPDLNARLLLFFLFLGVISLVIARELVFCAPPYLRTSPRFMAVIAGGYGGFIILRGLATLWMPLPALFAPSSLQLATVVVSAAAGFLSTFGFIIMNSERLEHEIRVAGRKLEEERGYLRTVLDSVQSGVIVVDAETHRIVDINAAAGDILGVGREAMAGAVCHGRVCPAEIGKCPVTDLARTVDKGEGEVIHRSSRRIPVIKSVVSVTINGRRCLLESFVDMTERKAAGEALQRAHDELEQKVRERTFQLEQSRQRYRDLAELLPETIFEADAEGRLTYVNFQASETFLYNREELEGIPYDALIAPRDRGRLTEDARKPRDEVAAWGGEYLGRRKDGSEVPLFIRVAAMKRQGVVFGLRGVLIDLTELKRAEEALRKSEEKYRRLFENSRDAIFIATHEGRIVEGNAAFFELFGYDREEMNMLETDEIFVEERQSRAFLLELRERGSVKDFELKIRKKDGSTGDCLVTASREYSTGGMEVGLEGIIRDVTERRHAERALREGEKKLAKANRALRTLSAGNELLINTRDEMQLIQAVCTVIVEKGGYAMAWVGYVQDDAEQTIVPKALAGVDKGYMEGLVLLFSGPREKRGPAPDAVRLGSYQLITDTAGRPDLEFTARHGFKSILAMPLLTSDGQALGVININATEPDAFDLDEIGLLQELANDLIFGIETLRIRTELDRISQAQLHHNEELRHSLEATILAIGATVEMRDAFTAGHQRRVADLAAQIAREMGLPEETAHCLHLAGIVHDLGKINVPADILSKPGRLRETEYMLIKTHPEAGYNILKEIEFPWPIADIIIQHHERLDGSGYPRGLKGQNILLESRIMGVADTIEAMVSHRPYRAALGIDAALDEISHQKGVRYDPEVVEACLRLFRKKGFEFK